MTQEQLDNLFKQAQTAPLETSSQDVRKWIGYSTLTILIASVLSKVKLLTSKTIIMYTGVTTLIGAGITAVIFATNTGETKISRALEPKHEIKHSATVILEDKEEEIIWTQPIKNNYVETELESFEWPLLPINLLSIPLLETKEPIAQNDNSIQLKPFTDVQVSGEFTLVLIQGDEFSYRTEGDFDPEKLFIAWDAKQDKGLYIDYNSKMTFTSKKRKNKIKNVYIESDSKNPHALTLYLTFKSLESLKIGGFVKATTEVKLIGEKLNLQVSGSSKLEATLNYERMNVMTSGIASAKLNCHTKNLTAQASGSSNLEFTQPLQLNDTELKTSGTSQMHLQASMTSLKTDLSGASTIKLAGDSKVSNITVSGTSNLEAMDFHSPNVKANFTGSSSASFQSAEQLQMNLSGTSVVKIVGTFSEIKTGLSGASSLSVNGSTNKLDLNISGTSKFNGKKLVTTLATVKASGASIAYLDVKELLDVYASGTSTTHLISAPNELIQNTEGAAKIIN